MTHPPDLTAALCALSYYRHRHDTRPLFKSGRRAAQRVPVDRTRYVARAREYIAQARALGFRGSIRAALLVDCTLQEIPRP